MPLNILRMAVQTALESGFGSDDIINLSPSLGTQFEPSFSLCHIGRSMYTQPYHPRQLMRLFVIYGPSEVDESPRCNPKKLVEMRIRVP